MDFTEREKLKAVVYDFDGTLTPDMQPEFKILERCGMEGGAKNPAFFKTVHEMAERDGSDPYAAMAQLILEMMRQSGFALTDENIAFGAARRVYNPGVPEFLRFLKNHGVSNYLLSSGLKAYLKHLTIAPEFAEIYATVFSYDKNGEVDGITRVMSPEEKAVALTEVASQINGKPDDFSGVIYVGDGPTDLVAMEHIKKHGGKAIFIRHENKTTNLDLPDVENLDVDLVTKPDYTDGSEIMRYIKQQLD